MPRSRAYLRGKKYHYNSSKKQKLCHKRIGKRNQQINFIINEKALKL